MTHFIREFPESDLNESCGLARKLFHWICSATSETILNEYEQWEKLEE